ncbi:MAG: ribosome silencing factor [Ruminococcaceae bacterium]|nr:ribosome silencing factor [Oscillospiraceae bacterium]
MTFDVIKTNELSGAEGKKLAEEAVKVLLEKLAIDVTMYNVTDHTSITDYYVNATGRSSTHVASLADDISDNFEMRGQSPLRVEGKKGNSWILVDYGTLIVNIFDSEGRAFYNFDRLLPEESKESIEALKEEVDKKFNINKKEN